MSGKPALLPLPSYFWVLVIASYLFADRIGCTIGRFFCANLQLGLGPRKRTNWVESEILPFAESNRIH